MKGSMAAWFLPVWGGASLRETHFWRLSSGSAPALSDLEEKDPFVFLRSVGFGHVIMNRLLVLPLGETDPLLLHWFFPIKHFIEANEAVALLCCARPKMGVISHYHQWCSFITLCCRICFLGHPHGEWRGCGCCTTSLASVDARLETWGTCLVFTYSKAEPCVKNMQSASLGLSCDLKCQMQQPQRSGPLNMTLPAASGSSQVHEHDMMNDSSTS